MPINADHAVDTSVAVAALDASHAAHSACVRTVRELRPALAGHAAFETHSVITRMPTGLAIGPAEASQLMRAVFPVNAWLTPEQTGRLFDDLGRVGILGGAVYDALVGTAARDNGLRLLTRDRRAESTYELLGVDYTFVTH